MKQQIEQIFLRLAPIGSALLFISGCSPLLTSPHDEKHQWELTVHEVQTNLNDLHHDMNCFQAELQILEERIKYFENAITSLKQQDIEKQQAKIDQLAELARQLEKRCTTFDKAQERQREEEGRLLTHAKETQTALVQFKDRIEELEREFVSQNARLETLAKIKGNLEVLTKSLADKGPKIYKVRAGDSLDKIAKAHKISVEKIKQANRLEQDLIVIGQELTIPE